MSTSREIVALAIGQVLQQFLSNMKSIVPSQDIVRRITQGIGTSTGSRFSEFKDILLSMMNAYSHEVKILEVTLKMHMSNLHEVQSKRILRNKRAERFDDASESIIEFRPLSLSRPRVGSRKLRDALKDAARLIAESTLVAPLAPPPFVVQND